MVTHKKKAKEKKNVKAKRDRQVSERRMAIGRKFDMQHASQANKAKGKKDLRHSQQRRTALATLLTTTERGGRPVADRQAAVKKTSAGRTSRGLREPTSVHGQVEHSWQGPGRERPIPRRGAMTRVKSTSEQPTR